MLKKTTHGKLRYSKLLLRMIALLFNSYKLCSEFQVCACNANRLTL
jgi:hypothetical protein